VALPIILVPASPCPALPPAGKTAAGIALQPPLLPFAFPLRSMSRPFLYECMIPIAGDESEIPICNRAPYHSPARAAAERVG